MMKILPVLEALQHLQGGMMGQAEQGMELNQRMAGQPYTLANMLSQARENEARANLTQAQGENYQQDRMMDIQNKALASAGEFGRGMGYIGAGNIAQGVIPQLLSKAGIDYDPDAAMTPQQRAMRDNLMSYLQRQNAQSSN